MEKLIEEIGCSIAYALCGSLIIKLLLEMLNQLTAF